MINLVVNAVCFTIVAGLLGSMGYGYTTWQFWAILVTMLVAVCNVALLFVGARK